MDIHRCRFVHYPPSTINVLAFSHSHLTSSSPNHKLVRLAIGRANGDIEIWNPLGGAWLQETVLKGGKDRSIDGLVWTQDPSEADVTAIADGVKAPTIPGRLRLFSVGYSTTITEWDLERGRPLRQSSGNHGEIWCLAAQPPMSKRKAPQQANGVVATAAASGQQGWEGQNLIAGCTDGALALYSTEDQDLVLKRVLVRPSAKKAKIISAVFKDRNIVVAGCTDSVIRIYDIRNGSMLRTMSLGSGPSGGPREIIVWSIKCLPNGNLVSGDSTGEVRIWDGKTYTMLQRIQSHKQDVLSLATSADGSRIFSGGMDRRTVSYKQVGGSKSRWAEVSHRRFHNHDVKCMASFEAKGMSVVASGGPDTTPIIMPLREFGREHHRTLSHLPQEPLLQSAPGSRLLVSWWDREVLLWRIQRPSPPNLAKKGPSSTTTDTQPRSSADKTRKLVAKIAVKGDANISSTSISSDGSLLAVATAEEVKLFQMGPPRRASADGDGEGLHISKLELPASLARRGGRHVQFSPDSRWLCVVRGDNLVSVARLLREDNDVPDKRVVDSSSVSSSSSRKTSFRVLPRIARLERLDRQVQKRVLLGGLGAYERTVTRVAFSADGRILAVSDLAGYIDTWVLEGVEDLALVAAGNDDGNAGDNDDDDASSDGMSASDAGSAAGDDADNAAAAAGGGGKHASSSSSSSSPGILGERWIRNPSASLIPRVPGTPVVLSFRPSSSTATPTTTTTATTAIITAAGTSVSSSSSHGANGAAAILPHATRGNPHPQSHHLSGAAAEDRLLVVTTGGGGGGGGGATAKHVLEFHALRGGSLSGWSRANPTSCFPQEFRGLRDAAMGCFWDVRGGGDDSDGGGGDGGARKERSIGSSSSSSSRERLWLYGPSWMWMFDLSRNFPSAASSAAAAAAATTAAAAAMPPPQMLGNHVVTGVANARKRKRAGAPGRRGGGTTTTGAGSRVPDREMDTGMARRMYRVSGDRAGEEGQGEEDYREAFELDATAVRAGGGWVGGDGGGGDGMDLDGEDEEGQDEGGVEDASDNDDDGDDDDDDDDDDGENDSEGGGGQESALMRLRRGEELPSDGHGRQGEELTPPPPPSSSSAAAAAAAMAAAAEDAAAKAADVVVAASSGRRSGRRAPHWWHTYKYRPILGIVPLGGHHHHHYHHHPAGFASSASRREELATTNNTAAGEQPQQQQQQQQVDGETEEEQLDKAMMLEVALVERPLWEVDLPPGYYGDQEWEKPGM